MTRRLATMAAAGLLLVGCRNDRTPVAPTAEGEPSPAISSAPRFALADLAPAVPQLGWLAPLGTAGATNPQDETLTPTVTVCVWRNAACASTSAQFTLGAGLTVDATQFAASWNLNAATMPLTRTPFRIAVTVGGIVQGLPVFVDAMRGRWATSVPGQTPALVAAASLPLRFRIGAPTEPPPPPSLVASGIAGAGTQFLPALTGGGPRTPEQTATIGNLGSALGSLGTALGGAPEEARTALGTARSALDAAKRVAPPGDQPDLTVIQLELDQAGRLLGVGG